MNLLTRLYYRYVKRDNIEFARKLGVRVGDNCQIIADPSTAFGSEPWLIKLGNHVDITEGVRFVNHEGGIWCVRGLNPEYEKYDTFSPIVIGNNVLIGMGTLIMPGVTVGDNVIIAAHCIISKDVPSNSVVVGTGKILCSLDQFYESFQKKERFETKKMTLDEKRKYLMKVHPEWFE